MGWRMVQQPNGLFARFSDVVDNFTHTNLSEQEALDLCRELAGREEAVFRMLCANNCPERWQESLDAIAAVHGQDAVAQALREIST